MSDGTGQKSGVGCGEGGDKREKKTTFISL